MNTPSAAGGFLTAYGSRDSHATTLAADGKSNGSRRAGRPYETISWDGIVALVDAPAARQKNNAQFFIPSTYAEFDGRTHAVQRERGWFGVLAVDVDTGNIPMVVLLAALSAVTGGARAAVYSSSSATPENRKWRALVPLATPVAGADYPDTQLAFFELLEARGIRCDVTLSRTGQPVYLPNVPPKRRGPDGRPLFYERHHMPGPVLELVTGCPIIAARDALRARREAEAAAQAERAAAHRAKRLEYVAATGDEFEPIAHFNANHTVAAMLARYGFEQKGRDYKSPLSESGSYSTRDCGDHWVAVSAWAHNHNVGRRTSNGNRSGDAFDLYVAFEHNGDKSAAVRAYAEMVRPPRERNNAHVRHLPNAAELPPPGRVETLEALPTVSLDDLRADLRRDMAAAVAAMPSLVVVNAGTGVGKTERAVELLAGAYDRVVWVCTTHDAATETVARLKAAGHDDVAAIPPRDATTCRCWTPGDLAALAEEYPGNRHMVPMEAAIRVGNPHMACLACPLSGLVKTSVAVPDEAFAAFTDPDAEEWRPTDSSGCQCEYWRRKQEAEAARVTVMCQARYLKATLPPVPMGTTRAVVIDERGTDAVLPRQSFTLETMRATRDALATAVDNWRQRKGRMRFGVARERENELVAFGEAVRGVADKLVAHMEAVEAAGQRHVDRLPPLALPKGDVPKRTHDKIARLLVNATLPAGFNSEALDVIRRVAGGGEGMKRVVYAEPRLDGTVDVQLVKGNIGPLTEADRFAWDGLRELEASRDAAQPNGSNQQTRFIIDADADLAAIRRAFPDVLEIAPRGVAPLEHDAKQWWFEINPQTHPAVVLRMLELAIHENGFTRAGVVLPLAHRRVLFPVTRPRNGRPAEDKEPDPAAIANWGGRGGRGLAEGTAEQRMARAVDLVERVRRLRAFIARDEHGRLLVEHHRGTTTRGSNRFLDGTDGGVVLGCSRANPGAVAAYMLGTGRLEAVRRSNGTWGDVEGDLPAVGGGTTKRRWRGYACPEWAEAARLVNRAELTQTCARFRPTLEHGKPLVVVAAEPTGLPVTDPPATIPEGVAAVVGAVRELLAGTKVAPGCEDRETHDAGAKKGESRKRSIGHTFSPFILDGLRDSPNVTVGAICAAVGGSTRAVQLWLADAVRRGLLVRTGAARATRYALPAAVPTVAAPAMAPDLEAATLPPPPSILTGLVDTPGGPSLTDDAPAVLLGAKPGRTALVAAIAAAWRRRQKPDATPEQREAEALDFLCGLLSTPPPAPTSRPPTEPRAGSGILADLVSDTG